LYPTFNFLYERNRFLFSCVYFGPFVLIPTLFSTFFNNKGAVAGTFTAVGVVVAVILVLIATRWVRRRRERKFDLENDEAAAAAAAAGANPDFHDDYDYRSGNTNFGGYSETSHGTLAQPALPPHSEAFTANNAGYGATDAFGVAGVGAAATQRARSQRNGGGTHDPYNAFGVPNDMPAMTENYEMADANNLRYRRSTGPYQFDPIIGAFGAGDDPYAIARGQSVRQPKANVSRGTSLSGPTAFSTDSGSSGHNQPGQPFRAPYAQQQQQSLPPLPTQPKYDAQAYGNGNSLAYGGIDHDAADLPNPHSANESAANLMPRYSSEDSAPDHPSYIIQDEHSDDEEPEHNSRVLRVRFFFIHSRSLHDIDVVFVGCQ
jgi:hypothetical protein